MSNTLTVSKPRALCLDCYQLMTDHGVVLEVVFPRLGHLGKCEWCRSGDAGGWLVRHAYLEEVRSSCLLEIPKWET